MTITQEHTPVMLHEVSQYLAIQNSGIYVDGTFGRGGHSKAILNSLGPQGRLYAFDKDPSAVQTGKQLQIKDNRFEIISGSFANLQQAMTSRGLNGKVNGILLDLGVSSPQLDDASRGFSFLKDGPLDMRMNTDAGVDAATWINSAKAEDIAFVLKEYGEERYAKRIAGFICKAREQKTITTTLQLAEIVKTANPAWEKHKHPATRAFQAIRIFINSELDDLQKILQQALDVLAENGRLVVISFHSLEDRIVKRFLQKQQRGGDIPADLPLREDQIPARIRVLARGIKASTQEVDNNPRARSAILRAAEKLS